MFFEGAEKKAEIQVNPHEISLLNDVDDNFWHNLVKHCHAQILSSITNESCKAFLLSESSLFVWDDRFLILTCGETQLINSVEFFINTYSQRVLKQVTYQRKNEYFSHAQPSCFGDDIKKLSTMITGEAYRFGELDGHHNFLFHYEYDFKANPNDKTYEFLAYQISNEASKVLTTPGISAPTIREFLQLDLLLPNFEIDDFVFTPFGYSLNALRNDDYFTIHVTPQADSSYVSFESSINLIELAPKIIEILAPLSFDLLSFNETSFKENITDFYQLGYVSKSLVDKTLSNGYYVNFANFIKPQTNFTSPVSLNTEGTDHVL
ncbi:adenosylmethionine decarboxylase [Thalassotalea ganghwensis]